MGEIVVYVVLGLVVLVVEIQYRLELKRVKRFESLRFRVFDHHCDRVVFDQSIEMFEGLSGLDFVEHYYKGLSFKVYREGEGG